MAFFEKKNVTPRTKLQAPKDDFQMPLNYHLDFQGQTKTSLDVLQEVTIDDCWNMDGGKPLSDTIRAAQQKSTRRIYVGSRQTGEETG